MIDLQPPPTRKPLQAEYLAKEGGRGYYSSTHRNKGLSDAQDCDDGIWIPPDTTSADYSFFVETGPGVSIRGSISLRVAAL